MEDRNGLSKRQRIELALLRQSGGMIVLEKRYSEAMITALRELHEHGKGVEVVEETPMSVQFRVYARQHPPDDMS